jgi:hypothetical protein
MYAVQEDMVRTHSAESSPSHMRKTANKLFKETIILFPGDTVQHAHC